ncbi:MAG: pyridoxamine 5'-phosphate oxidase family protein [Candidatus Micrarchaeota archaeon]|nr:pyridoxamine 5'-phosphate oxidase family protein [Candidatus Micrarchaeota archaeon]
MENIRQLIKSIMDQGVLLNLATYDSKGPWACSVSYINDARFNVYWISDNNSRHSKAIIKNHKAAGTITLTDRGRTGQKLVGLQVEGRAERVEDNILEIATTHVFQGGREVPHRNYKLGAGKSWYKLEPTKVDLIYEPSFGMVKKQLRLPSKKDSDKYYRFWKST